MDKKAPSARCPPPAKFLLSDIPFPVVLLVRSSKFYCRPLAGIRHLTNVFTASSSDVRDAKARPILMNVLLPGTSPMVAVLQYFSHLLFEPPVVDGRVMLFALWFGCESVAQLRRQHRAAWVRLRTAVRTVMANVWRKHVRELQQFPWVLATLADDKATAEQLDVIFDRWRQTSPCCHPDGMSRRLRQHDVDLRTPSMKWFLRWWAYMVRLTTADIEVRHPRNTVSAGSSDMVDFSSVVAQYVNTEYSELSRCATFATARAHGCPAAPAVAATAAPRLPLKGHSPLVCFQKDAAEWHELKQLKAADGCFASEYWAALRAAFQELPEHRREHYKRLARRSKIEAAEGRKIRREQQKVVSCGFVDSNRFKNKTLAGTSHCKQEASPPGHLAPGKRASSSNSVSTISGPANTTAAVQEARIKRVILSRATCFAAGTGNVPVFGQIMPRSISL